MKDISTYIKKKNADLIPTYLIVRELKTKGFTEQEISKAMSQVRDVQVDEKKHYKPYAIIFAIFAFIAYIIWSGKTETLFLAAIILIIKTLTYAGILQVVLIMGRGSPKFEHCFYTGLIIAGLTFITPAFLMYFILMVTVFYMLLGFEGGNLKTYTAYVIFLIIAEVSFTIVLSYF